MNSTTSSLASPGPAAQTARPSAPRIERKRLRLSPRWLALPFPLCLLLLWYVAARLGWVAPQVLPSPAAVALTFVDLVQSGEMFDNLKISLLRVLAGFGVGLIGGLLLGVAMGLSPLFRDYVYPLFKAVSQVPVLGWLPLLMLLVGIDEALKIILISKAALVPIALNTYKGLENVPARYVEVAKVLKFTRWQLLTKVLFPAALRPIWNGVRYGFTHAWLALVVVELLASSEGLGYMIVFGRQLFQLDVVMAAVAVVGATGFVLDKGLALIETALLRSRPKGF
ncbi:MAG: sulfonate transporter [Herbaspirillum sp.]|jgi:sulfonate transport system permease protein|nr:sulfonate transporter [Herbaspirillum sp.]